MNGKLRIRTTASIFFLIFVALPIAAGALELRIALPQIPAGAEARLTGTAPPNLPVVITVTGPAPVSGKTANARGDGSFSADLGPFETAGDYTISAASGSERKTAALKVLAPVYTMTEPLGSLGSTLNSAADASDEAMTSVKTGLESIGGDNPDINKAKEDVGRVQAAIATIRRGLGQFAQAETQFEQTLLCEPNLNQESMREYEGFLGSTGRSLREQTEQLIALGREASAGQTDACVAVALAAAALNAQKTLLEMMNSGIKDYLTDWAKSADISTGEALPSWIPLIRDRFLSGMRSVFEGTPEEQVLHRTGAPEPESPVSRWTICKALFDAAKSFLVGGPWAAAKSAIESAVDIAIDAYSESHCLVFKGKLSGHTHVEALDNGRPMYGLDNDWEGDVEIMCAKPAGEEPVAFRGILTGRAKNFEVTNGLKILYEGKPGNFRYLTGKPSFAQQLGAVFAVPLEGTVAGGKLAIKARKGGVDFDGRVVAKLAVVVISTGSPVPLVQKYDTPYQPGWWQVTRALGEGGMVTLDITMDGDKRVVKKDWTRELSSPGARGKFKIKFDLCAGYED
jgi:alkylhydroperoxidase/carboxymuconolactone decarboxylase family protein YurZ